MDSLVPSSWEVEDKIHPGQCLVSGSNRAVTFALTAVLLHSLLVAWKKDRPANPCTAGQ